MPRAMRIQSAGFLHHVVCRGNDRQVIFKTRADYLKYCHYLDIARRRYPIKIYNFCLMDNHVHLLIEPREDGALSKFMEEVSKSYAKYFNAKYDHVGHVFQGRFKSFIVQTTQYFFKCSRYIDLNPHKAGIVEDPKNYPWSGYRFLIEGKKATIALDHHDLYKELGKNSFERQISYRAYVRNMEGEELDLLDRRAGVLGNKDFQKQIKEVKKGVYVFEKGKKKRS